MKKRIILILTGFTVLFVLAIIGCYLLVYINANGRTFDNVDDVPEHEYGLLLGTSPITPKGAHNFYFDNRIKAAVELYKAGKIKGIIVSGGNYRYDNEGNPIKNGCNELEAMCDSLVNYGVPVDIITQDYDGTRTLNSIVKAKEVYGLDSCIVISQQYHNERAIYQADHYGLKAVGYNAAPSHIRQNRIKNQARELLARVKLFIDLLTQSKPKFKTYAIHMPNGQFQDWQDEPDSISGIKGAEAHISYADVRWGFCKEFSTANGKPFYYNGRHGFYAVLPKGMGYNQSGENEMGGHYNMFYNSDTTLVVSASAMFYDVVLYDYPEYADSLKAAELDFLNSIGKHTLRNPSSYILISKGRIDHKNADNPQADHYIRKWLLKKDISNRECQMELTIYFNDSLSYRMPEFESIIEQFPDKPVSVSG